MKNTESPFTIVISTHLIEEVSNIIEDVIIIKMVKSLKKGFFCEDLLKRGYAISGAADSVDNYIKTISLMVKSLEDSIGNSKSVYILGKPEETLPET